MDVPRRTLFAAIASGLIVATLVVLGGTWFAGILSDDPEVDGEVVLDEPGTYQQPIDDVNDDAQGDIVPGVALVDVSGDEVRLSSYAGEPMVVNLWFSNCPPCQRELVDFAEVHAEVGDRVRFVGVDPFDTVEAMERFATARGVEYELLRDPDSAFTNEIGVVAFPVTLFVDEAGRILRQTGEIDADELRAAIDELF